MQINPNLLEEPPASRQLSTLKNDTKASALITNEMTQMIFFNEPALTPAAQTETRAAVEIQATQWPIVAALVMSCLHAAG